MNKLLVLAEDAEAYVSLLNTADLHSLEIVSPGDGTPVNKLAVDCNIILGDPALVAAVLGTAKHLQWVQSSWAGVDSLCRPGLPRDYVLTGVKGVFGQMISEYVVTYLFALERRFFEMRVNQSKRRWQPLPYRQSGDITVGIMGLGSIGQQLARSVGQFGIRVIGMSRSGKPCEGVERVYTSAAMAKFLVQPDYLVITLPDTPQTRHLVNAESFKLMKSSAVLINVGRGCVINESELVEALHRGDVGGAVLDVFDTEPLPDNSPLWAMSNVYITPHHSAVSFPRDVVGLFVRNYQRFVQKKPLLHVVDFERGY